MKFCLSDRAVEIIRDALALDIEWKEELVWGDDEGETARERAKYHAACIDDVEVMKDLEKRIAGQKTFNLWKCDDEINLEYALGFYKEGLEGEDLQLVSNLIESLPKIIEAMKISEFCEVL
jgi:hypothetical protein